MKRTVVERVLAALALSMLAGGTAWAQMTYQEAPMLAAMVEAGDLPPVDERLPSNPLVVEPFDSIGTYGGTVRMMDVSDRMSIGLRVRHTGLFRYNQTASAFEADLAESHAWSNDNRTLTLKLREGLRWSDGEPFTTADMLFKWEQDITNEQLSSSIDPFYTLGGEPAVWEALDDYTLRITWAAPNPVAMDASDAPTSPATTCCSCPRTTCSSFTPASTMTPPRGPPSWVTRTGFRCSGRTARRATPSRR